MNESGEALVGRWRLVQFTRAFSDTGEIVDAMGPHPRGTLTVSDDRYMTVIITGDGRSEDLSVDRLFGTMMAYAGRCEIDDRQFITEVEVAWHPAWVGSHQVRNYELSGDELRIVTAEQTHPSYPGRLGRGLLVWQRASGRSQRS